MHDEQGNTEAYARLLVLWQRGKGLVGDGWTLWSRAVLDVHRMWANLVTAHCGDTCPFAACPECAYAGGMYRVDHLPTPMTVVPETSWWLSSKAADDEEARLRKSGKRAVAWWDAQGTGVPRDLGRELVREGLQAAIGWLRINEEGVA